MEISLHLLCTVFQPPIKCLCFLRLCDINFDFLKIGKTVNIVPQLSKIQCAHIDLLTNGLICKAAYFTDHYFTAFIRLRKHHISAYRTSTAFLAFFHRSTSNALIFFHHRSTPSAIFAASSGVL